jgi:hypothetical protein
MKLGDCSQNQSCSTGRTSKTVNLLDKCRFKRNNTSPVEVSADRTCRCVTEAGDEVNVNGIIQSDNSPERRVTQLSDE